MIEFDIRAKLKTEHKNNPYIKGTLFISLARLYATIVTGFDLINGSRKDLLAQIMLPTKVMGNAYVRQRLKYAQLYPELLPRRFILEPLDIIFSEWKNQRCLGDYKLVCDNTNNPPANDGKTTLDLYIQLFPSTVTLTMSWSDKTAEDEDEDAMKYWQSIRI